MSGIKFSGPASLRVSGFLALNRIAISTYWGRIRGQKRVPSWDVNLEIGVRFWRRQFTQALQANDISVGRKILDAVQTETPDIYAVEHRHQIEPKGDWYIPQSRKGNAHILYLHGGGYAFHGAMSRRFAAMLAHHIGAPVFAPDYRLTPEHPHPAQADDALAAWQYLSSTADPDKIVVIGDSAGGHMMLSLLLNLEKLGKSQPALGIGLCPWTDIGDRGASLHGNDPTDLVQGWMALKFGEWLDPEGTHGRAALSPINHSFKGLAPLYLQTGGKEILCDMIVEFAEKQASLGADVMLDCWPNMPHDFQLLDSTQDAAGDALKRIVSAVRTYVDGTETLDIGPLTLKSAAHIP